MASPTESDEMTPGSGCGHVTAGIHFALFTAMGAMLRKTKLMDESPIFMPALAVPTVYIAVAAI
jgi:hypothetical protein